MVHLVEVLSQRSTPAAGVSIGITRRCPLSCAHCATDSTLNAGEVSDELLLRFAGTFSAADGPRFLVMSGGEPLLRPGLVRRLADRAREIGCRSMMLSGAYFARLPRIPGNIRKAIRSVDHFSVSLDVFHEREVPRADVMRLLAAVLADGIDVSVHVVGTDESDPYLSEVTDEVVATFDGQVPMLVNGLSSFGRARSWLRPAAAASSDRVEASPCLVAAWPLVGFDGTIVGCSNDDVINGPAPTHLRLGHVRDCEWSTVKARCAASSMLRAIRLVGPEYLADRLGQAGSGCDGYCGTCMRLSPDPAVRRGVEQMMARPSMKAVEAEVAQVQRAAGAVAVARRQALARYADLVTLGAPAYPGTANAGGPA